DNAERFIFFSRAALLAAAKLAEAEGGSGDDIILHCHDWPTGLTPMCLKNWRASFPILSQAATLFTYHNLANQGLFLHYDFAMTGLDWSLFTHEGLEFHGHMNLTKAGLLAADIVTTVSDKYAQETLTADFGLGLEGVLRARQRDIFAVPNGVDYEQWDPSTDTHIAENFTPNNTKGKETCRGVLAEMFGFSDTLKPTVAMVCRLLPRKGLDIIVKAMESMLNMPINLAFMGLGEPHYQEFLRQTALNHPGKVGYKQANDLVMTHHLIAGADIFIMPSRFEPCGLEQLYALKYGTVPLVRATGGLDDTIIDVESGQNNGTGYKFTDYTPEAFLDSLGQAVLDFNDKPKWAQIQRRGMDENFSWDLAATRYEAIYKRALMAAHNRGL
ncbi:MAG: glycogen synthase, partial [Candidatus Adiutrix sp.]